MFITDATFMGQDGSMGYRNSRNYRIIVDRNTIYCMTPEQFNIPGTGKCVYQSVESFLKNWKVC